MKTPQKILTLAACVGLPGTAHAQFDDLQNYGDGRTDGGGGTWIPLAPNGATIVAGGGDMWGNSDRASFLTASDGSLTTTGDFTACARHIDTVVASTNDWGREPLMMRAQPASGTPLALNNPSNLFANSAHYMTYRRSNSDVDTGWRHTQGQGTQDDARTGGGGFTPTKPIGTSGHFMAIARSGAELYSGHACDISFGLVPGGTPGRWLELHNTVTGRPHPNIGAGTEVTVGVGHQSHNDIPGGGGAANTARWDSFSMSSSFNPNKFGPAPAGDYNVFANIDEIDAWGGVTGWSYTFENGAATGEPTGWKIVAEEFTTIKLFGVANSVNSTVAPNIAADLVPSTAFRRGPGMPGLNADIYLASNPGNSTNVFNHINGNAPSGSTTIPNVWWANPGNQPANGYPDAGDNVEADNHGGANSTNKFAQAVAGQFTGSQNSYGVHMTGEIQIPASAIAQGCIGFKDGVDDFTFLAIDGVTLIDDNSWTGLQSTQNQGGRVSLLDTSGYSADEWVSFEMVTWEGGGGDTTALYWDIDGTSGFNGAFPILKNVTASYTASGTGQIGGVGSNAPFPTVIPQGWWDEVTLMVKNTSRMAMVTLNGIHIDHTPPTIVDLPPKTFVVAELGETSATATWEEPTAEDAVSEDPTIEQTGGPENGGSFPLGVTEVEYTATDTGGNTTIETFKVVVKLAPDNDPGEINVLPIATTDDIAPGGFGGGTFSDFEGGYIAGPGNVIVEGQESSDTGLWRGNVNDASPLPELLAQAGDGTYVGFDRYFIAKDGNSAYRARTVGGGEGHWYAPDGSGSSPVAVLGGPALGSTYNKFALPGQGLNKHGEYCYLARVAKGTGGVTKFNDWAIFDTNGDVKIRKGDVVWDIPGGMATYLDFEPQIALNKHHELVFSAAMRGGPVINGVDNRALFRGHAAHPEIISRKGDAAPDGSGDTISQFGCDAINKDGSVAFSVVLTGAGVTTANNTALYTNIGGTVVNIVREGDAALGLDPGQVYSSFSEVYICGDNESVWFKATVAPAVATENDAIYVWRLGAGLSLVAKEGDIAPGTSGVWKALPKLTSTHCCHAAFTGLLRRGVGGVTRDNEHGLWFVPVGTTAPILQIRGGDTFECPEPPVEASRTRGVEEEPEEEPEDTTKTVRRVDFAQTKDDGMGGRSSALGAGNIVVMLTYDGGQNSGVYLFGLCQDPGPKGQDRP